KTYHTARSEANDSRRRQPGTSPQGQVSDAQPHHQQSPSTPPKQYFVTTTTTTATRPTRGPTFWARMSRPRQSRSRDPPRRHNIEPSPGARRRRLLLIRLDRQPPARSAEVAELGFRAGRPIAVSGPRADPPSPALPHPPPLRSSPSPPTSPPPPRTQPHPGPSLPSTAAPNPSTGVPRPAPTIPHPASSAPNPDSRPAPPPPPPLPALLPRAGILPPGAALGVQPRDGGPRAVLRGGGGAVRRVSGAGG
ncbi:hypothetical protein B0T25DRAFT_598652, partial [Lasiosphaeria hispida]